MNKNQTISEIINVTPWSRHIYHDADSYWQESKGLHHAYIIYRTLRGDYKHIFQPDAVFYVGRSPAARQTARLCLPGLHLVAHPRVGFPSTRGPLPSTNPAVLRKRYGKNRSACG